VIPQVVLVAACPFGGELGAARVAAAIGRGLRAGGMSEPDLCPIDCPIEAGVEARGGSPGELQRLLAAVDFDARMRRARALVIAEESLSRDELKASATFEIATRARQAGVPAYAVARDDALDAFDARILDLQVILEAGGGRALVAAGRKLATLI